MTEKVSFRTVPQRRKSPKISQIDLAAAWISIGRSGAVDLQFRKKILHIVDRLSIKGNAMEKTPSTVRKRKLDNILRLSERLLVALEQLPDDLDYEITDYFMYNFSPEDHDGTQYEGMMIDEIDRLNIEDAFGRIHGAIADIQERHSPSQGRPKTNGDLEGLCCTNPMKDSPHESSMIAAVHEQLVPYKIQDDKLVVIQ